MLRKLIIAIGLLTAASAAIAQPTSLPPDGSRQTILGCEWNQGGGASGVHAEWDFSEGDTNASTSPIISGAYDCNFNPKLTSGTNPTSLSSMKTCPNPDFSKPFPCDSITIPTTRSKGCQSYHFTFNPATSNYPVGGTQTWINVVGSRVNESSNPGINVDWSNNRIMLKHGDGATGMNDTVSGGGVGDGFDDLTVVGYRNNSGSEQAITPTGTCSAANVLKLAATNYISVTVCDATGGVASTTHATVNVRVENSSLTNTTISGCDFDFSGGALPATNLYFGHGGVAATWAGWNGAQFISQHSTLADSQFILPTVCFWGGGFSRGDCTVSGSGGSAFMCTMERDVQQEWSCSDGGAGCAAGDNARLLAVSNVNPKDNAYLYVGQSLNQQAEQFEPSTTDPTALGGNADWPGAVAAGELSHLQVGGWVAGSNFASAVYLGLYENGVRCGAAGNLKNLQSGVSAVQFYRAPITAVCDPSYSGAFDISWLRRKRCGLGGGSCSSDSDCSPGVKCASVVRVGIERAGGGGSGQTILGAAHFAACLYKNPLPSTPTPTNTPTPTITNTPDPLLFTPTRTITRTPTSTPTSRFSPTITLTATLTRTSTPTVTPTGGTFTPTETLGPSPAVQFHRPEAIRDAGTNTFQTKYTGDIRRAFIEACAAATQANPATVVINADYTGASVGSFTPAPQPKSSKGLGLCSYLTVRCADNRNVLFATTAPGMSADPALLPLTNVTIEGCYFDGSALAANKAVLDLRGISYLTFTRNTLVGGTDHDLLVFGGTGTKGNRVEGNRFHNTSGKAVFELPGGEGSIIDHNEIN